MDLKILKDFSLRDYNTFGVDVFARYFVSIQTKEQLNELFLIEEFSSLPKLILGGGSNILFTKDYEGLVVFINIKGIRYEERDDMVEVTVGAGEVWSDLVQFCVANGFGGVENLSLIPGKVGAAPVQNIGAYGVELKDVFSSCIAFDTHSSTFVEFSKAGCKFGYRSSIFKGEAKGRYIITSIKITLARCPEVNTSYGAIEEELKRRKITEPNIQDISTVVSDIRTHKLPNPSVIGNAGSFFKNPIVKVNFFRQLQSDFVDIPHFIVDEDNIKLAAGWLIEQCGWKGAHVGNTGTWKNQALVLVNYGNAKGSEVYEFSERIIASVYDKFKVMLEREVNIV